MFVGFDESNHGLWPEFFVCVLSYAPADAIVYDRHLSKVRNPFKPKKNSYHTANNMLRLLDGRDFRFIQVDESLGQRYHVHDIGIAAVAQMLRHFQWTQKFIIDGRWHTGGIECLRQLVAGELPELQCVAQGDQRVGVVHAADYIAYALYSAYREPRNDFNLDMFENNRLQPDLEGYLADLQRVGDTIRSKRCYDWSRVA